jgi:poly(3-hydroxybutyrate) depolymerase
MTVEPRKLSRFVLALALLVMFAGRSTPAEVQSKSKDIAGTTVDYVVVLPNGYNPAKTYPAVLAFPGGAQDSDMVEGTLERNWQLLGERLGYIVIIPEAPDGQLFLEGGAKVFPEFLVKLLADYKVLDGKFHIAGVSNGGLSAFHIASLYPQYFWSVTGLPGLLFDAKPARVQALSKLCIYMYAGSEDTNWLNSEKKQADLFRSQGFHVEFSEEKGEGHVMHTLDGEGAMRLFKQFEQARQGCAKQ